MTFLLGDKRRIQREKFERPSVSFKSRMLGMGQPSVSFKSRMLGMGQPQTTSCHGCATRVSRANNVACIHRLGALLLHRLFTETPCCGVRVSIAAPTLVHAEQGAEPGAESGAEPDAKPAEEGIKPGGEGGTSFEAAELSNQDTPHYTLMIVAYVAMWCLLLGYAFVLFRRQRTIAGELADLRKRIVDLSDLVEDELES